MSFGIAVIGAPFGAVLAALALGVKAETSNDEINMPAAGDHRDPIATSFLSVVEKTLRWHLACHQAGMTEDIGGCSGTIEAVIVENGMTSTPFVGEPGDLICCRDGTMDLRRGFGGREGFSVL